MIALGVIMPELKDWDGINPCEDKAITTQFVAMSLVYLGMLWMEENDLLEFDNFYHKEALIGAIFRSRRLNVDFPNSDMIRLAATMVLNDSAAGEEHEIIMELLMDDAIPEVLKQFVP